MVSDSGKKTVEAECAACGGTGIYHGMAEPEGVGVVCLKCNGTGKVELKYTPFTGRKESRNVSIVRRSRGSLVALSVGPTGGHVTYLEFLKGKMPS